MRMKNRLRLSPTCLHTRHAPSELAGARTLAHPSSKCTDISHSTWSHTSLSLLACPLWGWQKVRPSRCCAFITTLHLTLLACGRKKKKAVAGQPYFAQRRFTVVIERSWVGSTHFCDGEAFPVSAGSASAMEPPLSSWDERLGNAIDAAVQAGVDEGSKLLVAARTARAVRASWFRCAKEAAEEELAQITDVQATD